MLHYSTVVIGVMHDTHANVEIIYNLLTIVFSTTSLLKWGVRMKV